MPCSMIVKGTQRDDQIVGCDVGFQSIKAERLQINKSRKQNGESVQLNVEADGA